MLSAAAGIQLDGLVPRDFADYLRRTSPLATTGELRSTVWEPVLTQLREQQHSPGAKNVAEALTTPLMVDLARTVYHKAGEEGLEDLLVISKFPSAETIQHHLLAAFVPGAYRPPQTGSTAAHSTGSRLPPRWDPERAEHWLGYLAIHLTKLDTHDIEWWQLGPTMKPRSRMLVVGATVGLASGLVAGSEAGLVYGLARGLRQAVVNAVIHVLGVGLTFGLVHGFATNLKVGGPTFEPSFMSIQIRSGIKLRESGAKLRKRFFPGIRGGLASGLLFGGLWALAGAVH